MIRRGLGLLLLGALAACSPKPRSTSYFEGHPEEAAQVVVDCAAGKHRGEECLNAKAGAAEIRRKARMDTYKKNF
jgi:hypothetical protein